MAALYAANACAHKPSDSYLTLTAQGTQVAVRWDVALRDLDPQLGLDVNDDGLLSWGEVRSRALDIAAFVAPELKVSAAHGECTRVLETAKPVPSPGGKNTRSRPGMATGPTIAAGRGIDMSLTAHSDGTYVVLEYRLDCSAISTSLQVDYRLFATTDPTHRGIVRVAVDTPGPLDRSAGQLAVLGPGANRQVFILTASSRFTTLRAFVVEGIWHIWLGFDHVLFLLTLLLPSVLLTVGLRVSSRSDFTRACLDVLRIVTAFTLAHSVTLTLAVLGWVSLPSRLVESGIALTVVLGALNNLRPVLQDRRWVAAFVFGLIHGFGFAGALKALNLPASDLAVSLFGFNVGVEIGQLAIVATFVPVAFSLRHTAFYRLGVLRVGSILIALIATAWFVERATDVKLLTP